jgi:hypothetical protein
MVETLLSVVTRSFCQRAVVRKSQIARSTCLNSDAQNVLSKSAMLS